MTEPDPMTWYRIEAPAPGPCGGIEFNADSPARAIHGAPIFRWMRGKTLAFVQRWCAGKGWKIDKLERPTTASAAFTVEREGNMPIDT